MLRKRRPPFAHFDRDDPSNKRLLSVDEANSESSLECLLIKIGDGSHTTSHSLESLVKVLEREISRSEDGVADMILKCAVERFEKLSVYTTICGLLYLKNQRFCCLLIDKLVEHCQIYLDEYKFQDATNCLILWLDLVNVGIISITAAFETLDDMIQVVFDHNDFSLYRPYIDWILTTILKSLPLIGSKMENGRNMSHRLEDIMNKLKEIISERGKIQTNALRVWSKAISLTQEEYVDLTWKQVSTLRKLNWKTDVVNRPYLNFPELSECQKVVTKRLKFPPFRSFKDFSPPRVVFRMFDHSDQKSTGTSIMTVSSTESFAKGYLEDCIENILIKNQTDVKECAKILLDLSVNSKYPTESTIIEVIFNQMFRLPVSPCPLIVYGSLILELCDRNSDCYPVLVANTIGLLFERLNFMNVTCLNRLCMWFSFHLSNHKCKWSWDKWEDIIIDEKDSPQKLFLRELFTYISMMYYPSYIEEALPVTYHYQLPKSIDGIYRFSSNAHIDVTEYGSALIKRIVEMLLETKSSEEILQFIKDYDISLDNYSPVAFDDDDDPNDAFIIDCVVQTLLKGGAKTISHTEGILERYQLLLKDLTSTLQKQVFALRSLYDFWRYNFTKLRVFVIFFVRMGFADPIAVIHWILHDHMKDQLFRFYVWEILEELLLYIKYKKIQAGDEIHKLSKAIDSFDSAEQSKENEANMESLVVKLELAQKDHETIVSMQKSAYLSLIQRLIMILTSHVRDHNTSNENFVNQWFVYVLQRLQQILITHHSELLPCISTLESQIFTKDVDQHIFEVFKRWKSICG